MNKATPLISIAMATYNGEKFIIEQLDSIINQSYKNIEIIICDDNSTDKTVEILKYYSIKFPLTIIQNEVNLGIVKSFEISLKNCIGEYIVLSDQDDIFLPNKIELLLKNIKDSLLIHSDSIIIDKEKIILYESHFDSFKNRNKKFFLDYLEGNNVTGNSVLINKDLLKYAIPFPKYIRIHDHYLAMCASYYGNIRFIPDKLQFYRQHTNNSIGIKKNNYDTFINNTKADVRSYIEFIKFNKFDKFNQELYIHLTLKLGIINGRCNNKVPIKKVLSTKGSIKLIFVYILFYPKLPYLYRKTLYAFLSKFK
jgi:glycosyltransferase involved in cell wall biosynthesis